MSRTIDFRLLIVAAFAAALIALIAVCAHYDAHTTSSADTTWQSDTTAWKGGWR